ncbi:MAG: hypothetical protein CSB23_00845 [Deltaproteobacteria bacterium]|nr:MAG: hypothetical protein CSB23_00845 [Deltaproteobacteria bacterium]
MSQEKLLIILLIVAVVVFVIGFLIGKAFGNSSRLKETHRKFEAAEKELADYKASVSQHFGQTADLIDNLTRSYKAVFEHLGSSARELLTEEELKHHLQSRANKAVTLTYLIDESTGMSNPQGEVQAEVQPEEGLIDEVEAATTQKTDAIDDDSEKQSVKMAATDDEDIDVAQKTEEPVAEDTSVATDPTENDTVAKPSTDTAKA